MGETPLPRYDPDQGKYVWESAPESVAPVEPAFVREAISALNESDPAALVMMAASDSAPSTALPLSAMVTALPPPARGLPSVPTLRVLMGLAVDGVSWSAKIHHSP